MRLSARSYPHPVLGNRDDIPNAAFQATLEMITDRVFVYISVEVSCSCDSLKDVFAKGKAVFVMHVECSNTMFRKAYTFKTFSHRVQIPADCLNNAVEVNIFASAEQDISPYLITEAHPDYAGASFHVKRGDVLAVAEGHVFYVDSPFDSLKRIGSIMQIIESAKDGDIPMEIECGTDKLTISLSKNDFANYKLLKHSENALGPLTTTIVLPALFEALHVLAEEGASGLDDPRRWVRALTRRIEELQLQNIPPLESAQKLLELPIRRALLESRRLAETAS